MSMIAVNAKGVHPVADDPAALGRSLANLPAEAPVMILLHGYRYSPSRSKSDPHRFIFSLAADLRTQSWPRRLGFGRSLATPARGLCVAFGWEAGGSLWRAYAEAGRAGQALAGLIRQIRAHHAGPLHLIGHSLGARVALAALPGLGPGDVNRMVLMAGAEFRDVATAALHTAAGRGCEVLNVTSRENDIFDFALERLLSPFALGPRVLGAGLNLPQVVTVQIDHDDHREALRRLGFPTLSRRRLMCHWSSYTRPGLFPLYRAFLRRPDSLPLSVLRATLPETVSPRWSVLHSALRPMAAL